MQKEEITRIMKLVQDGKLSPEDAAELIDAFDGNVEPSAGATPPSEPPKAPDGKTTPEPFTGFIDAIERIGKDVSNSVNWTDIATQLKSGLKQGADALRHAVDEAKVGKFNINLFGNREERTVELEFQISGDQVLKVTNQSGDIKVVGGASSNKLVARATVMDSDPEKAKERAAAYTPIIEESDGAVVIRQPDPHGLHADLELHLATCAGVELQARDGDIRVESLNGTLRAGTDSGDVSISKVEGTVDVRTSHGDVVLSGVQSPSITVEAKSGTIRLEDAKGALNLRTASGDIRLDRCAGRSISIEAVSGDITADLIDPIDGVVTVRAVQGDAHVTIADGSDCRVVLSTLRGSVDCMLDLHEAQRVDRRVTGQMGNGTGSLDVSAVTGDITLRQRVIVP